MNALKPTQLLSPAEYLARELDSPIKHEYVGGVVHAMSGARTRHNRIATSVLGTFRQSLKGRKCEPFNSDMKVRIQLPSHVRFYYPDAMVVCQPNPDDEAFQDHPKVIVEVLSRRTRRLDMGEKREGYLRIASLAVYLMVEQDEPTVVAYRRSDQGFERKVYQGLEAVIELPEIGCELPLAEIYDRVEFGPEPEEDDED
ncbi:MAG: Uma2 family endonuclease [Candidatus Eremiobacteraeota bacterium]|nr:Uma2 family endonuclease [Candidatus Eremiobacteraeota bacterium]MCW5868997.1 Uma2 family endonuclease [Candidatus Eremiobacteraeota bacterium]